MKNKILIILILFVSLTNCSIEEDYNNSEINQLIQWHLTNVTGGIAGIDDEFDLGTIIWTFKEENNIRTLTIVNENNEDSKEDFLESGTYTYFQLEENGIKYLKVNDIEYGALTIPSEISLRINTNQLSNETRSDGFIYNFRRVTIQLTDDDQS